MCAYDHFSLFGFVLTFGAMIGAVTSGPIADFIGQKGKQREIAWKFHPLNFMFSG